MSGDQIVTVLTIILSASALTGIMWRRLSPVVEMAQQLHGEDGDERRGIAARPGILERQTATERRAAEQAQEMAELRLLMQRRDDEMQRKLDEALAQLRNNGGSSMKDVGEKTLAAVTALAGATS